MILNKHALSAPSHLPVLGLVLTWIITRALLLENYLPIVSLDAGTYQRLANQIVSLDFDGYNGQRTPVYPLLLLLAGNDIYLIWLAQSLLGLFGALLIFYTVHTYVRSRAWAFVAAFLCLTSLNLIFFEPIVFTESVGAFFVSLLVYLYARLHSGSQGVQIAVMVGLAAALLILARPQFVFLIMLLPLLVWFQSGRRSMRIALAVLICTSIPVLSWMTFNRLQVGQFSLTTLLGYNLSNHTGAFMEYAPDNYAQIRDIYLKHRQEKVEQTGTHTMTVFWARKELLAATGLDEVALSKRLQTLSLLLIKEHPVLYMNSVVKAWASFWAVPNYWQPEKLRSQSLAGWFQSVWNIQQPMMRVFNALFLLIAIVLIVHAMKDRNRVREQYAIPFFIAAVVLATAIVQALVEYGENPRYSIPIQPLVVATVVMALADVTKRLKKKVVGASGFGVSGR